MLFKKKTKTFFSSFPADNGSTLSSEAITDSATSTDNNYGYMGMGTFFFWPVTLSLQYISIALLAGRLLQTALIPHWFSICFCLLGPEPFKRRPILNHLHHLAIYIGDALPYNSLNHSWDIQQINQSSMNHTSMTCSCQQMDRFLISWQWSEQQNDIEIRIFWLICVSGKLGRNSKTCYLFEHLFFSNLS